MIAVTDPQHRRPAGVDDGWVDDMLDDGLEMLREAGNNDVADGLSRSWSGRNVIPDMWTLEPVEAFERTYYEVAVASERHVREVVMNGRQHVQEAERKVRRLQDGPTDYDD